MRHPLDGVKVKIDRAGVHLDAIDAAVRNYAGHEFPEGVGRVGPGEIDLLDQGWQQFRWNGVPDMDLMVGAMLGDYVHNLRCALDHAVWTMVRHSRAEPGKWTHFPVAESEAKWRDDVVERSPDRGHPPTFGLADMCMALVEDFQPFKLPRKERSRAPLLRLVRIDNVDKHRALHGAAIYLMGRPLNLRFEPAGFVTIDRVQYPREGTGIENGADLAKVKVKVVVPPPPDTPMRVKFDMPAHVAFYAQDRFVANHGDLRPMLDEVQRFYEKALALRVPGLTP
jgi:hypothetical protein